MPKVKEKSPFVRISLTGGLGNQLFQLAFALHCAKNERVSLESALGNPRVNTSNLPEIMSFELPDEVTLSSKRKSNLISKKIAGYLLRCGVFQDRNDMISNSTKIRSFLGAIILSISYKEIVYPVAGRGNGFFEIGKFGRNTLFLGYFQSYHWASNPEVYEKLQRLKPHNDSTLILRFKKIAENEKPLVVHFRLGDYKFEKLFGIPPVSYYREAIKICWDTGRYNSIWAFSDEEDLARELYGSLLPSETRWVSSFSDSAATNLELMRFGHGYVISNSTFSWWGAFLSYHRESQVLCPSPWFIGLESPKDLIPKGWVMLECER